MAVSLTALFMSLGGVGYAATQLPDNSVGSNQIQNGAVTYKKIQPNAVGRVRLADGGVINSKIANDAVSYKKIQPQAVGRVRANLNQLQARINDKCGAGTALTAVDNNGKATCSPTLPSEFGATNAKPVAITGTAAPVASVNLPAGATYLAFGNPDVTVTSGATAQTVNISCTLTVGTATSTRTATVRTDGTAGDTTSRTMPLQVAGAAGTSSVACSAALPTGATGSLPTTTADSSLNALQTASNS